jgi:hypothetical protein
MSNRVAGSDRKTAQTKPRPEYGFSLLLKRRDMVQVPLIRPDYKDSVILRRKLYYWLIKQTDLSLLSPREGKYCGGGHSESRASISC